MWRQRSIVLSAKSRGFHLITAEVLEQLPEVASLSIGLLHLMLQHTSASLLINENADPDVRLDLEAFTRRVAPDDSDYFQHTLEGPDDMPAHIKSAMFGVSVTVPITDGSLALGTWQGLYLGEHRHQGGQRRLVATLQGEPLA